LKHISKIFSEVRIMATQLSAWRFLILSVIGLMLAATPFILAVGKFMQWMR